MSHKNTLEKILKMGKKSGDCIIWTGGLNTRGYGVVHYNDKSKLAHRLIYEEIVGKIPQGLVLDHLCRNRACINPSHLEIVTNKENILRGVGIAAVNSKKTHCINGHELKGSNLRIKKGRIGRICRKCNAAYFNKWYRKSSKTVKEAGYVIYKQI